MTRAFRLAITALTILTMLAVIFLVQTNSRSSILIKEASYVAGGALALMILAAWLITDGNIFGSRISRNALLSFVLLMAWIVFRHFTGVGSVNGEFYIYSTVSIAGLALVIALFFDRWSRETTMWVLVVCAFLLSIYALLQSLGIIIFSWDAGLSQSARSSGTLGNANLLGSFAMAMIPVGSGFLMSRKRMSNLRYPAVVVFSVLCTGALLASKTRGSLLGVMALLAALPFVPFLRKDRRRLLAVLLILLVLIGGSVLLLSSRMEELVHAGAGTLQVRLLIWSGALRMWQASPLAGYGPGSFQIVFPGFRNPDYFSLGVSHNTLHSHCEYLEILVDSGIVGLLLWIMLAFMLLRTFRRNRAPEISAPETAEVQQGDTETDESGTFTDDRWMILGLTGGILALLAEGIVSVALRWPPSAMLLGILVGLLLSCISGQRIRPSRLVRYAASLVALAVSLLLLLFALPRYLDSMKAGKELFRGKDVFLTSIAPGVQRSIDAAMDWSRTQNPQAAQRAVDYFLSARQIADSSMVWCERCVESDPELMGGWYALGSSYVSAARLYQQVSPALSAILTNQGIQIADDEKAQQLMSKGLEAYDALRELAPDYAEVHNNLALVFISLGNPDSALSHLRRAWDLHAHNRNTYSARIRILNSLTRSVDGVYIKWQGDADLIRRMIEGRRGEWLNNDIAGMLLFDYGTTFLRFPQHADSLCAVLDSTLNRMEDPAADTIRILVDLQLRHLQEGLDLADQLAAGDTAGVLARLQEMDMDTIRALPVHACIYGTIMSRRGDLQGMELLCSELSYFNWNGIDEVQDFPLDISDMYGVLNTALIRTGLDTPEEKRLFLGNLVNMLKMDRNIFQLVTFIESSQPLMQNASAVHDRYLDIWSRIGGPMYSFMNSRISSSPGMLFSSGSIMDEGFQDLQRIEMSDSLDPGMTIYGISWLFSVFASSYSDIPHYSNDQIDMLVSLMSEARQKLVEMQGESETQYSLGRMFSSLYESGYLNVMGEFANYTDALRNDLTMGRIDTSDLP